MKETQIIHQVRPPMRSVAERMSEVRHPHHRHRMPWAVGHQVVMPQVEVVAVQVALEQVEAVVVWQEIVTHLDDGVIDNILGRGSGFIH